MSLTVFTTRILLIFALLFVNCNLKVWGENGDIAQVINYINTNSRINFNLLIKLVDEGKNQEDFLEVVKEIQVPKLIINNNVTYGHEIKPVYEKFNSEILTIVWFSQCNINNTFELLDHVLWKRHYKDIFLVYQRESSKGTPPDNKLLMLIFQKCWSKGFISVLMWYQKQLYTYHPYPQIKVVHLEEVEEFMDKSYLNNFHQRSCLMPFFEFPNQCYSYKNRQGKLIRTGYFYKWLQLYFDYYNGSMEHLFIDMWSGNTTQVEGLKALSELKFCMIPIFLRKFEKFFDISNVMHLSKVTLMVPNAKEVPRSLYLVLPFSGFIWFIIIVSGVMIFILMYFLQRRSNIVTDLSKLALQAFSVFLFISSRLEHKTFKHYLLHLLFLFTGIFLTTYYSSSLSSLFTSKEYEPQLKYLNDIARTDLTILEYTADVDFMLQIDIPKVVKQRIHSGNNTELRINRHKLNMTYMYTVHEEFMDYILFQQYYLKHPIAKKLDQELFYRAVYVTVPHRSPLIDHFNRYLMRIRENGLVEKSLIDTKWDGVVSGNIKIMLDPEVEIPLGPEYLRYAFVIWCCGLLCASVVFVIEYKVSVLKSGGYLKK